jgi:hypothetical protein
MKVFIATFESKSFSFDAFGATDEQARVAIRRGLDEHLKQDPFIEQGWVATAMANLEVREVNLDCAYRDRELLSMPTIEQTYIVRFTPCPTAHNSTIQITTKDLSSVIEQEHGRFEVKRSTFPNRVVLDEVYVETASEKVVHYKHRGFAPPHISAHLKQVVQPAKKEVLA